jgi:hypothetical protein
MYPAFSFDVVVIFPHYNDSPLLGYSKHSRIKRNESIARVYESCTMAYWHFTTGDIDDWLVVSWVDSSPSKICIIFLLLEGDFAV